MAAGGLQLASAGDDIKLWDCTGYTLLKKFNPHSNNVSSLAWSHDNSSLASASVAGDKIVVSYSDAGDHSISLSEGEAQGRTCLAFSSLSRYVVGGGPDAMIYVWDLKTQKMKKAYKGLSGPVTTLQFNYNDTVIASGSESGEIMLYNVVTGLGYMPLKAPKGQAVRQLQYSYMKKTLLGSVSDDGGAYLWDTNTKRLVHSFDGAHKAPASGLAFSPLNHMLLLSIGLDKKIVCYDVLSKKHVKVLNAESPLTSVDLQQDGSTVAVGSTRGKVYIYDLRQGANPLCVTVAHSSSVHCLRFQKNLVSSSECGEPVGAQAQPSVSAVPPTLPSSVNSNVKASIKLNSAVGIRGGSLPPATSASGTAAITKASSEQELLANGNAFELGDVFSPVRDLYSSSAANATDTAANLSDLARFQISDDVVGPNNDPYQTSGVGTENGFKVDYLANALSNSLPDLSETTTRTSGPALFSPVANPAAPGRFGSDFTINKPSGPSTFTAGASASEAAVYVSERSLLPRASRDCGRDAALVPSLVTPTDAAPSFEAGLGDSASATSCSEGESAVGAVSRAPSSYVSAASTQQPFQVEFIRNVVREVFEDFYDQIRQDILNVHMEVLKQSQLQQTETRSVVERNSVNADLVAEIQRLREENARLKKNY